MDDKNTFQTFDIELIDKEQIQMEQIRLNFIRKVFITILIQISFTLLCSLIGHLQIIQIQQITNQPLLIWIFVILLILVFFLLISFQKLAKQNPYNYISYITFTISISFIFIHCNHHNSNYSLHILSINCLQLAIILSLINYSYFTKNDITIQKGIIYITIYIIIFFLIILLLFQISIIYLLILSFIMILYGIHIISDTILIVNGEKHELDADDYIIAALMTQVDILGLFQIILQKIKICNYNSN